MYLVYKMMDCCNVRLWVFFTLNFYGITCQTNSDDQLLQRIIKEKHLSEDGYAEFALTNIHPIIPHDIPIQRYSEEGTTRYKRSTGIGVKPFKLTFTAFNKTFTLTMKEYPDLLPSYTPVIIRSKNGLTRYAGTNPDCFLDGRTEENGFVALTYCHGFTGSIREGDYIYRIDPVGELTNDMAETVVVSRGHASHEAFNDQIGHYILNDLPKNRTRSKRGTTSTSFTIEVSIFVDADHVTRLINDGATDYEAQVLQVASLWNGVQAIMALEEDLGYTITIQIKQIVLWETNPSWYVISDTSGIATLNTFCNGIPTESYLLDSDTYHLHTQFVDNGGAAGYANIPGTCVANRCGISKVSFRGSHVLVAHELGHTLGMLHDGDVGCEATKGIMDAGGSGSYSWSSCSKDALASFVQSANPDCLFAENVPESDVDAIVAAISLGGVYEGMTTSIDQYCVSTYGTGFYYRAWYSPLAGDYCYYSNCVNMNEGANFGEITRRRSYLKGSYCGDGLVCWGTRCITWAETRIPLDKFAVVEGGWSEWGAYTSTCSRDCGTGIIYRERFCSNPEPLLAPYCNGSRTEAIICNTEPCSGDPDSSNALIEHRADEVCASLIAKSVISSADYDGSGEKRSSDDVGKCEVSCLPSVTYFDRYALLPDGTPCSADIPDATFADNNGYPRSRGLYGLCARGYCEVFGCDGTTARVIKDGCGVCGGDSSTCQPVDGVFTDPVAAGTRYELVTLPVGTTLIQFYFNYRAMDNHFIELYDTNNKPLYVPIVSQNFDSRSAPVAAAGTEWYYYFATQFMYAYGPLTSEVVVKIYNLQSKVNVGITYGYSIPLASTPAPSTASTTTSAPTIATSQATTTAPATTTSLSTSTFSPAPSSSSSSTSTSSAPSPTSSSVTTASSTRTPVVTISSSATTTGAPGTTSLSSLSTTSTQSSSTSSNVRTCGWGYLKCPNSRCIYYMKLCDGVNDCGDNTDETYIGCSSGSSKIEPWMFLLITTLAASLYYSLKL